MGSSYTYTAMADGSIRLMSVSRAGKQLTCEFFVYTANGAPAYDAISYAWGGEDASSKISVDGKDLPITPSVHEILCQLYKSNPARKIWIDAICINQADNAEKAQQVRRMHEIYGAARQVVVWLGSAGDRSDLAMDNIPMLHGKFPNTPGWLGPKVGPELWVETQLDAMERYGLPNWSDPVWPALRALLDRSVFRRLWIVQEVVLAKVITVLCGNKKVNWTLLFGLIFSLDKAGLLVLIEGTSVSRGYEDGFLFPYGLGASRDAYAMGRLGNDMKPFMFFVRAGRMRQVTEPVDRIYGFLGLASQSARECIRVDYSENGRAQYWKTYIRYSKLFLAEDKELALLSMASSQYKPNGLPSWCPNFNACKDESSNFGQQRGYQAGFGYELTRAVRTIITPGLNSIQVPGFRIDTVMHVGGSPAPGTVKSQALADEALAWEAECFELSMNTYSVAIDNEQLMIKAVESYVRTLMANRISTQSHSPAPPLYEDLQRARFRRKHHDTDARTWDWNAAKIDSMEDLRSAERCMGKVTRHQGCRFFSTHGNRFGLGPRDTKPGDVVCVLYSAAPVFILRFEPEERGARLVGDAYVDGIMKLDELPRSDRGRDEMFTIV